MSNIIKENLQKMITLAQSIEFERNPGKFIEYLTTTDFFIAPASKGYHGAYEGGLYKHSHRIYDLLKHMNDYIPDEKKYSDETLFYVAFMHDLAKINIFKKAIKWRKDEKGNWENYMSYDEIDEFPCGHGAKSLALALSKCGVQLTEEEMLAINYHMGPYLETDYFSANLFNKARAVTPLVYMLHSADVLSIDLVENYIQSNVQEE